MGELNPVTANQMFLSKIAGQEVVTPKPVTADQMFLAKMAGMEVETPQPVTVNQMFMQKIIENGGSGGGGSGEETHVEDLLLQGAITEYYNDRITQVRTNGLANCYSLVKADFPNVVTINEAAFSFCMKLKEVNLPKVRIMSGPSHFAACYELEFITLPSLAASIADSAFNRCSKLKTVLLPQDKVVPLASTGAFNSTPFATNGTGGTVYVPQAHIESYKTATNWSTLYAAGTCNFVAIEGSEYE